jgi:hypothetical protein
MEFYHAKYFVMEFHHAKYKKVRTLWSATGEISRGRETPHSIETRLFSLPRLISHVADQSTIAFQCLN